MPPKHKKECIGCELDYGEPYTIEGCLGCNRRYKDIGLPDRYKKKEEI